MDILGVNPFYIFAANGLFEKLVEMPEHIKRNWICTLHVIEENCLWRGNANSTNMTILYYPMPIIDLMIIRNWKYHKFLVLQATMSINGDSPSQSRNSGSHRNGNWKNSGHNSSMKSTRSNNQTNLQKDYAMRQKSRESRRGNILRS